MGKGEMIYDIRGGREKGRNIKIFPCTKIKNIEKLGSVFDISV